MPKDSCECNHLMVSDEEVAVLSKKCSQAWAEHKAALKSRDAKSEMYRERHGIKRWLQWSKKQDEKINCLHQVGISADKRLDRALKLNKPPAPKHRRDRRRRREAWWAQRFTHMQSTWEYKAYAYEFFTRRIRQYLDASEQVVFFFIFERTVWWFKEWETIRMKQFVSGSLPRSDGTQNFCGTGLSERTVQRALVKLIDEKGLVVRREKPGGNGLMQYSIVGFWLMQKLPYFRDKDLTFQSNFGKHGPLRIGGEAEGYQPELRECQIDGRGCLSGTSEY